MKSTALLEDLGGQRVQGHTPRRQGGSQRTWTTARAEPVRVPLDEIRQRLDCLGREHAGSSSPDETERSWDEIEHQRAGDRAPRTRSAARRNTVTVPEDELRRTIAAITQRRAEESFRGRAARLRSQEETGESDRQGAEEALRTQMPQTQTLVSPKRIAPSLQRQTPAIPQAPTPRKRPQDAHPDGLLTPPPTRPDRTEKRPRLSQSLQAVLQYRLSSKILVRRGPLALQVEAAKSFHQAFTDERTLPILHCSFCCRKQPHSELTTIRWKWHLAPSLLQATAALQECRECFPVGDDAEALAI
ncbi:unnamed protein product [Clonostachys chloroleuca]|uniref:Uncharacterized protein n=1 Tax=Clonostachys chloroleuca TaxID=1926264 RepID=A0AA35Q1K1_9HYPO|nr:unnamed protein product [Clonostachys chloroleuca]